MYLYGYKTVRYSSEKLLGIWCRVIKKKFDQLAAAGLEPRKGKKALRLKAALPSLVLRLRSSSSFGFCSCCYPERLREIVALPKNAEIALLVQELGRVLLQLIPPTEAAPINARPSPTNRGRHRISGWLSYLL